MSPENNSRSRNSAETATANQLQHEQYELSEPEVQYLYLTKERMTSFESNQVSQVKIDIGQTELWLLNSAAPENTAYIHPDIIHSSTRPDWLLIDFDHLDWQNGIGFEGIYNGETKTLGRSPNNLPPGLQHLANDSSISREHFKIRLRKNESGDDQVDIGDLNSSNGTILAIVKRQENHPSPNPEDLSDELDEISEYLSSNPDMQSFSNFYHRHKEQISQQLQKPDGIESLAKTIYSNLYARNERSIESAAPITETQQLKYARDIDLGRHYLSNLSRVEAIDSDKWAYYRVNHDRYAWTNKTAIGRFYLNLEPGSCPNIQTRLIDQFLLRNTPVDIKIPAGLTNANSTRLDKMVVYFEAESLNSVLEAIEEVHSQYEDVFLDGTPLFTAEVNDSSGQTLCGVGFGQEPINSGKESFGGLRSDLLANLAAYLHDSGKELDFQDNEVIQCFKALCDEKMIDSTNLALNKNSVFDQALVKQS